MKELKVQIIGLPSNLNSFALDALWYALDTNFEGRLRLTYTANKDRIRALRIMSELSFMDINGQMIATAHNSGSVEVLHEACTKLEEVLQMIGHAVTSSEDFDRLDAVTQHAFSVCVDGLFTPLS